MTKCNVNITFFQGREHNIKSVTIVQNDEPPSKSPVSGTSMFTGIVRSKVDKVDSVNEPKFYCKAAKARRFAMGGTL